MAFVIARIAKQKGGSVGASGQHNDRTRETPNADPARIKDNEVLIGPDRPVREIVDEIIAEHGGKPRSDSVEAVEVLITASPEWFLDDLGNLDAKKVERFKERSVALLRDPRSGGVCAKATFHGDERSPHIQAHMVPIDPSGKLNCKYYG